MKKITITLLAMLTAFPVFAQRPIIQTKFTADPAPMVHRDTVYLYTTHDEDDAEGFKMRDWLLYTSTDMVNWTDHGAVASLKDFKWYDGDNGAWAEQVIYRNGKFYMYCPIHGHGIGVLEADSPYGPFRDPIGKPIVWQKEHWNDIDPTAFIDEDGQAYLYWGNPNVYYVKLNEDMTSYSGEIHMLENPDHYQEGPWFYRRQGHYYLAYASTCCPEGLGYAMSDSPTGPWTFRGYIMSPTERTRGNHPGIIDYKGHSYIFGFNYELNYRICNEHHERRSVHVAEMHYNPDGTIQEVPYWSETRLEQLGHFDPFRRVEAETMAWGWGLKTGKKADGNIYVNNIDNGEYLEVQGVDFKKGARQISMTAAATEASTIEVRLDSVAGPLAGIIKITPTGSIDTYHAFTAKLKKIGGIHDLYFCFKGQTGKDALRLDWWQMR